MHEENNEHFIINDILWIEHNGAAYSLLDKKCMYCNCEIKYVYIANWFPLGES